MLHLIKLAVGAESLEHLERLQREAGGPPVVRTRSAPRRREEVLAGGSIYRVITGLVLCRQRILDIESVERPDGSSGTIILLDDTIVPVEPRPARPFQGWRYLDPKEAPRDLETRAFAQLPASLSRELGRLGLL